ncbi:MAG: hypothetical protein ACXU9C_14480, partial [Xanthobacteraceae bacterium]
MSVDVAALRGGRTGRLIQASRLLTASLPEPVIAGRKHEVSRHCQQSAHPAHNLAHAIAPRAMSTAIKTRHVTPGS